MSKPVPETIVLNQADNVALALRDLRAGRRMDEQNLTLGQDIAAGHKLALGPIRAGEPVRKYGQIIGFASSDIQPGDHVHVHNLEFKAFERSQAPKPASAEGQAWADQAPDTFMGFLRPDGRAGTRNYLGVITTVNCTASLARFVADAIPARELAQYPGVDGIIALGHGSGCCVVGEGRDTLERTLSGIAQNPNFAGALLVGLGCETMLAHDLAAHIGLDDPLRLRSINAQETGGTQGAVEQGAAILREMLKAASAQKREPLPVSKLTLGLECGGSDAYSGVTANPALGAAADILVQKGGCAILSETPEIYGAEHLLVSRAASPQVAQKLMSRIKWWENYTRLNLASINNNPTPGNKAGGLSTILEKSLGAVAKGGSSPLNEVYRYAEQVRAHGLVFMDTPGYDAASITGMAAGGANLVCFTTGRGTVYGFKPTPVIKLASNSAMYERMQGDMDINCGLVLEGVADIPAMGRRIYDEMLAIASGKPTKSEAQGYGEHEFVPWHLGVVM